MPKLKINPEMRVLSFKDKYILYFPIKLKSMLVNADTIRLLNAVKAEIPINRRKKTVRKIIDDLMKFGTFDQTKPSFKKIKFQPTSVSFLPSFICNLICIYCYSEGGDDVCTLRKGEITKIRPEVAFKAIDFIVTNAIAQETKKISVSFHGGGEPMLLDNKNFIEQTLNYAKQKAQENDLQLSVSAVTNGLDLDKFDPIWLKENFNSFNLSLDGPRDIQNFQRPRRGKNSDSYTGALRAISIFEENGINYGIRSTITKYNVHRMEEMVNHFLKITKLKNFHFEPLFECGRCKTTQIQAPTPEEYVENFRKASDYAITHGIEIYYSGASTSKISDHFCGAAGSNFFITPDEHVTTCLEACRSDLNVNQAFLIGKYDDQIGDFIFNNEKIETLSQRLVTNMPCCAECIAKYHCSGDCLIKVKKSTGNMMNVQGNDRCQITIEILTNKIIKPYEEISVT
jgi:uncharacterized protein